MWHAIGTEQAKLAVDRIGTTLHYSCATSNASLAITYCLKSNQLRLQVVVGVLEFDSGWEMVRGASRQADSGLLIHQALEQWRVVVSMSSGRVNNDWEFMRVMGVTWEVLEHLLEDVV